MLSSRICSIKIAAFILSICVVSSGCQTLQLGKQNPDEALQGQQAKGPMYQVRLYGGGKPTQSYGELTTNKTIQDVLEESGAIAKFPRMEITLVRNHGVKMGESLKMPVSFDSDNRQVSNATNYSIRPGDVIVVRRDNTNPLTRVISKVAGPLSK